MKLGWIDFSKEERNKVLSVIDLLSEDDTLDELGISPIRDGFANVFFPGTSTIQTRAKYFLIVPYILSALEKNREANPGSILNMLDAQEKSCGELLLATKAEGVIGSRALKSGYWVKRTPADIYWAGIRKYQIFTAGNLSLAEYIKASCALKNKKNTLKSLGKRDDSAEEFERDDADSGGIFATTFWKLPNYSLNWQDSLTMELTKTEAEFLKGRIISACPNSMLAYILENNLANITEIRDFNELATGAVNAFPENIRADYLMAKAFSDFLYCVRIRYNILLSKSKNEYALSEWERISKDIYTFAGVDIEGIFKRLHIINPTLHSFLINIKAAMQNRKDEVLDELIFKRECQLKGQSRAKLSRAGEFSSDAWIGGGYLDYRYYRASVILSDIFRGLGVK